jgi:glycerol-3-phosphate acyltransferase PlsX
VNGVCIIAHGSSSPKAIKNAIIRAKELVEKKMNGHIRDDIESNLMSGKEPFWKQIKKITFAPGNEGENCDTSQDSEEDKP